MKNMYKFRDGFVCANRTDTDQTAALQSDQGLPYL